MCILFGSYAIGKIHSKSDIDIALTFEKNYMDYNKLSLICELEKFFDIQVDLVIMTPTTDPLLRYEVLSSGKALDMSESQRFEASKLCAWKIYLDTQKIRDMRCLYVIDHIRKFKNDL